MTPIRDRCYRCGVWAGLSTGRRDGRLYAKRNARQAKFCKVCRGEISRREAKNRQISLFPVPS